ncbi:hypothetical protein AVEN_162143-1, partial [Araneus ventricosus]
MGTGLYNNTGVLFYKPLYKIKLLDVDTIMMVWFLGTITDDGSYTRKSGG